MYNMFMRKWLPLFLGFGLAAFFCGCIRPWPAPTNMPVVPTTVPSEIPQPADTSTPILPTPTPQPTLTLAPQMKAWVDPQVAGGLPPELQFKPEELAADAGSANLVLQIGGQGSKIGEWVYVLAAPFPTLIDGVKIGDVKSTWQGSSSGDMRDINLLVDEPTRQVLERAWGSPSARVNTVAAGDLLNTAWLEKKSWAILPFDRLVPRWKVIRIDGRSPFDRNLDVNAYGLAFPVTLHGESWTKDRFTLRLGQLGNINLTNRDPEKLTVLVMTGVSALVRGSAWFMEQKGLLYPGRDIRGWLLDADLTHVSNEVSFDPECPPPNPNDPNLRFCSDPKNIQLLEDVGVDIVEMTGNHLNDFGWKWVNYTIDMYKQRNWLFYGAGPNQEQARQPVMVTHHGNKLAFIGCNPAGPPADWATSDQAGSADCGGADMDQFVAEVKRLVSEGYLTIVTVQYYEFYDPTPLPIQYRDFQRLSDAGAVIVSGSQAHLPQAMEMRNQGFIHYGLGNLFFDQMDTPWPDTKNEFIDRHVFYNGRYLGVQLLTATLEDYVKPRPMTIQEREAELTKIFNVSGWSQTNGKEWR